MKRVLKITGITFVTLFLLLFVGPYLFPETISKEVQKAINKNIKGEVKFESTSLSFFKHFPSLTLSLNQFMLKGAAPFEQDTLLYCKELSFGVNLSTIFSSQIRIDKVFLNESVINIKVDEKGNANYNVYESTGKTTAKQDTGSTAIKIESIFINKSKLTYQDQSVPMLISANGLNYSGKGDLSKAIFDLTSQAQIESLDVYYNHEPYLLNKKINARLVTKVNTNSLDLMFDENDLKINSLPIHFVGRFSFIEDGYDINFRTKAKETDLHNIFTVMPPAIAERLERTNMKGYAEIKASLIGKYLAAKKIMPTLSFNLKIRDGEIANPKAPEPISKLYLNLQTKLPSLNTDSLYINMDSLYFNIGKDYLGATVNLRGLKTPEVYVQSRANIDLEKWAKIFELDQLKGRFAMDFHAEGTYTKKVVHSGLRKVDTVIATIPKFKLVSSLKDGYFKHALVASPIDKISFNINGTNTDGDYKHTELELTNLNIQALSNYIRGFAKLRTSGNTPIDVELNGLLNFAEIKEFYPLKDLELSGKLNLNVKSKGGYNKAKKKFPVTEAAILLNNGRIKTAHFDQALEKISVDGILTNRDGTLKNTIMNIKPVSFEMGGQPFELKAAVQNLENVKYKITSKGSIDIGKMYRLFAVKGYDVKGSIFTDVSFSGLQSDATAGRYHKLDNKGKVIVKEMTFNSDLFPKSFLVNKGVFSFNQDKMKFEQFKGSYGKSDFSMEGFLGNVVNYVLSDKSKLTGNFNLKSGKLFADEFMAYHDGGSTATKGSAATGVIIIPDNLNVSVTANAGSVYYNGLEVKNATGSLVLNNGTLNLNQAAFNLVDAAVTMDAKYKSLTPMSASFDYRVLAKEFDIAKAYKEIKLFRDLATSASKVKGVVGLDYQLSGKLDANMMPVYPSLKGGGVLSVKKVSLMGFKFMNAVSQATKRDSLSNQDVSEVQIKSTIANNIINIERFKMRVAGFRPRFEGQVSFDGRLNMSGRLGLPPFGLFGIPLSITGTQDKPKVALKRNKEGKLEETAAE
ncbi:MAG: AsmA-like C-terminal region-containing protein [Candidatus Pedobacter colombiensis]|uniref:AsmA-like C-terminal region-containing protein n=1 Tax=Candidatus Pedobacter colombiensis TaxID=3121371 RepID=A0AAJ5W6X6_9SPHI|nr:AsmA family protein [Pedobacter sp.]WEK18119.1 MAG: AsmA-like C-terminal region-containing protein [Pedobacter sp.]